ncbi:MAG: hypothetical protein IRY99_00355 [Isosphaeraceae bacterium]|nr:hypothetical protein [Isosphaeraceae bacterium]
MVLVAATAAGLALTRPLMNLPVRSLKQVALAVPMLAFWTLAILVLRLRRPRPALHRLARQPGALACGAASLVWLVRWGLLLGIAAMRGPAAPALVGWGNSGSAPWWSHALYRGAAACAAAVAGAWLAAVWGGWRRTEPGWIDRLGQLLGLAWIAFFLIISHADAQYEIHW